LELQAYLSRRIVTPEGIRPGAVIVEGDQIKAISASGDVPAKAVAVDFGDAALLPGLVDSHVHINEPGRTDWGDSEP
jgi:allantoinase